MPIWLFIVLGFLTLVLVSGAYMFVIGCVRRKELPWLDAEALAKTSFAPYSKAIADADRWISRHNAQLVNIKSEDGLQLAAYWISAENARGTVLLAHGYRSNMRCEFCAGMQYFHELGYNILVPYQRSHGLSQGRFITFGVKESGDMLRWIEFHNQNLSQLPMMLYGISMGATTLLNLADQDLPHNVKGIIADCGFTSPAQILKVVFEKTVHLPAYPTLWAADIFARLFAGFSIYEKDTRKILASSKLPVLLIHGREDDFVPHIMSCQAYDSCTGQKDLLLVEKAGHGVSFLVSADEYLEKVMNFFGAYMPN